MMVALIFMISQIIYTSIGFGSGMFAISFLSLLYGQLDVFVPLFILINIPTEIYICVKYRKQISFKKNFLYILMTVPFIIGGAYLLTVITDVWPLIVLGAIICVLSLYFLFFEEKTKWQFKSLLWQIPFGTLSGLTGSLYGIGGPPLVIYLKGLKLTKSEFRTMSISVFFAMTLVRIPSFFGVGLFTKDIFHAWLLIMPFCLLGIFLGTSLHHKISEKRFKKVTSLVLFLAGVLLLLKNI